MRPRKIGIAIGVLCAFMVWTAVWAQTRTGTVAQNANLRAGPGTTFAIVGRATTGQEVSIVGQNADGSWYELADDQWIAAFLVRNVIAAPVQAPTVPAGQAAQVTNIVDGDTIDVSIDGQTYRVRYILMNTPERGALYFTEATEANRQLVAGKTVYLVKDVSETDRFNRLLRYVYLADGTFVNAELVRQGYAQLATFPPDVAKEAEIRAAQQIAVAAGVGLWADAEEQPAAGQVTTPGATATGNANLRGGPGTNFAVVGSVTANQALQITGRNADGSWYQLANGNWIAAFLVENAPTSIAVVAAPVPQSSTAEPAPVVNNPTPTPVPAPTATPAPQPAQPCDPSYPGVCIPPYPPDLDCPEIGPRRFQVTGSDPHGFDGDNDGIGCESG